MARERQPFEGAPATEEYTDENGKRAYRITTRTITPEDEHRADWRGQALWYTVLFLTIGAALDMERGASVERLIPLGLAVLGRQWILNFFRDGQFKETVMLVTEGYFAIAVNGAWECFNRQLPHRFALLQHDLAIEEQRQHEYARQRAARNNEAVNPKPYFGDSFIVCFEYLGQRHDLLTVYGRKDAAAILARLQACNDIIEARVHAGRGVATAPGEQWAAQPGDLA